MTRGNRAEVLRGDVFFPESGAAIVFERWIDSTTKAGAYVRTSKDGYLRSHRSDLLGERWFRTCDCGGSIQAACDGLTVLCGGPVLPEDFSMEAEFARAYASVSIERDKAEKERDQLGAMCAAYEEKFKTQREVVCAAQEWRETNSPWTDHRLGSQHLPLEALAYAVDALDKWQKERAKESAGSFACPDCGPDIRADEHGFCVMCGEDCKMERA